MSPRGLLVFKEALKNLRSRKTNMPFYAVARGREVGVFQSWNKCQELISNYKGAKFRKFETQDDAWDFVKQFRCKSNKLEEDCESPEPKIVKIQEVKAKQVKSDESSSSTFDFAAFNVRLTNLENSYQEKIRSLEERLRALENERTTSDKNDSKSEVKKEHNDASAGSATMSSTKRKLLDSAGEIIKPGSSRSYSTSALKRMKPSEDAVIDAELPGRTVSFRVDSDNYVTVYTDGACSKNGCGPGSAKAGIGVWFNDGHPLNVSAPVKGRATNNVAELQAATAAVEMAAGSGITKLCIMTDSQFTINCITSWIHNWKKNNWRTHKGEPVINKEEILELEKACHSLEDVKWVYVKGHEGIHGNEQADQLARNGATMYVISG